MVRGGAAGVAMRDLLPWTSGNWASVAGGRWRAAAQKRGQVRSGRLSRRGSGGLAAQPEWLRSHAAALSLVDCLHRWPPPAGCLPSHHGWRYPTCRPSSPAETVPYRGPLGCGPAPPEATCRAATGAVDGATGVGDGHLDVAGLEPVAADGRLSCHLRCEECEGQQAEGSDQCSDSAAGGRAAARRIGGCSHGLVPLPYRHDFPRPDG
jgi:hypothetical protein